MHNQSPVPCPFEQLDRMSQALTKLSVHANEIECHISTLRIIQRETFYNEKSMLNRRAVLDEWVDLTKPSQPPPPTQDINSLHDD